ncbi:UNKNOWN [Stylonychia lemnae]|uniref:Uncharacterized protein n=1 Tax=Stylonychia lemnae TaxID=5949 RepID=A0A078B3C4_STYLE|nr:UNKNOWN [Stylonychia lemnae]|eukprot:CDW88761.1 UNKNOWN [Stylonychia lemnae]
MCWNTYNVIYYKEKDKQCEVPTFEDGWRDENHEDYTDVAYRFKILLYVYVTAFGIESIRSFFTLVYLKYQTRIFYNMTLIFVANDCLTIVAFIALHVFRFQYSGRYCSGDYASREEDTTKLLTLRGQYILLLIGLGWMVIILSSVALFCIRRL